MTEEEKAIKLEKVIESRTPEQQKAFEKYKSDYVVHASVSGKHRKFVQYFYPDEHCYSGKETLSAAWHFTNVYSKHIKEKKWQHKSCHFLINLKYISWTKLTSFLRLFQ